MEWTHIWIALALLAAANGTPVLLHKLLGARAAWPIDAGRVLPDGERLLGDHKTWRGLMAGSASSGVLAAALDLTWLVGLGFGFTSLCGDALTSFVKRRLHWASGREVLGVDQAGEALLPLLLFSSPLALSFVEVLTTLAIFMVLDVATRRFRKTSSRAQPP